MAVTHHLERPTREIGPGPLALPYLALLRAGFGRLVVHTTTGGLLPHHFTLVLPKKDGMFLFH